MNAATFSFRVDEALKTEFTTVARAHARSSAQMLRDLMREFVQRENAAGYDAWFCRQVQAGLDSARAGRLIPAAEVEARFAAKRAKTRAETRANIDRRLVLSA